MTTEDYEEKYLGKLVRVDQASAKPIFGMVNSINRETAFVHIMIIARVGNKLVTIDEEYFEDATTLL